MVILRDMIEKDIEDYIHWFTKDLEWTLWDSPWEKADASIEEVKKDWKNYYLSVKDLPTSAFRWRFEIEADGRHIGWVCAYKDLDYIDNPLNILAIVIDIPEKNYRHKGYGTKALIQFIAYLKKQGNQRLYIQTWSGNFPMIQLIEKLGFKEYYRKKNYRCVEAIFYDAITYQLNL